MALKTILIEMLKWRGHLWSEHKLRNVWPMMHSGRVLTWAFSWSLLVDALGGVDVDVAVAPSFFSVVNFRFFSVGSSFLAFFSCDGFLDEDDGSSLLAFFSFDAFL